MAQIRKRTTGGEQTVSAENRESATKENSTKEQLRRHIATKVFLIAAERAAEGDLESDYLEVADLSWQVADLFVNSAYADWPAR